ncbi:hypothetical protein QWY31_10145 [Cytophagales bacterium LB-30]|uniref:Uncharacterized protein n=1 Tax=Shiella aurantiaca TaxID=3058365 RepID=A0ABT8F6L2_9BACT|nr:hypothetical protein [Shiella aurantiaca]MDN4165866.1 hypothetical protein [Shiella aurantiaca]
MATINFEEYKAQVQQAIELRIKKGLLSDPEGFILIDGFVNIQFQKEMGGAFVIGGPTIPAVAVVGKSSGLVYTFALKALLPNIQI